MKIQVLALGYKALKSLEILKEEQLSCIIEIVIGTDSNLKNDYSSDIKDFCIKNRIKYSYRDKLQLIDNCYIIAIGWRWMIKKNKTQELIIFHDSILPKYRGFNPLVSYLLNREEKIGVTCLFGSDDFDKGEIISQTCQNEVNYFVEDMVSKKLLIQID